MRIEAGLVNGEDQNKSKSTKKSRRRQKKSVPNVVQKLFDTCKQVFSSCGPDVVPSRPDVERLRSILNSMKPEDVGLNGEMPYFQSVDIEGNPPITYLHLYECDKFSIGIFCLPPSGVIPLHNHPGMTVFSKILFGSMHIKSYDWADVPWSSGSLQSPEIQPSRARLAKVKTDAVFTALCDTSILYPAAGGNMHCFTAKTSCAVLDVLGPPYSDPEGRHCMYYRACPYTSFSVDAELGSEDCYATLEEVEKPDGFMVVGAVYKGPKIVDN